MFHCELITENKRYEVHGAGEKIVSIRVILYLRYNILTTRIDNLKCSKLEIARKLHMFKLVASVRNNVDCFHFSTLSFVICEQQIILYCGKSY